MNDNVIIRVAARGDGVTGDGRYIAHAAPGDEVRADGGLTHGPRHQEPACQHFPLCGGCQLQHLDEASLADFTRDRIVHALSTQGVTADNVMPVHLSPPHARRRIAMRAGWTGKNFHIGFSTEKSHRIIDLQQCDVMTPELFSIVAPLRSFFAEHFGKRGQAQVKMTMTEQGVDLLIENWVADGLELHEALSTFSSMHSLARIAIDEGYGPTTFWEPEPVSINLGGISVAFPPYAFLQATVDGERALVDAVKIITGKGKRIADLFCGLGTFALSLAGEAKVYAAEADQQAIMSLKSASERSAKPVFTEHRDLFRRPLTSEELGKFDVVVLDPPRAGAKEQIAQFAASTAARIAYVSCNPNSFARDAKTLVAAGYSLQRLWPVGQFRWATHVEMVGEFVRA